MSLLDTEPPHDEVLGNASVMPGEKLISLCASIIDQKRNISEWEKTILTECFHSGTHGPDLCAGFIKSLRLALEANSALGLDIMVFLCETAAAGLENSLDKEADILPTTTRTYFDRPRPQLIEQDVPYNAIAGLLRSGARINGTDFDGKTALFYACVYGHYGLFQLLIQAGADTSPSWRHDTTLELHWLKDNDFRVLASENLFQVTLNAFYRDGLFHDCVNGRRLDLGRQYGRIAADLNRLGISCGLDDNGLVASLHAACYQGDGMWVEWVLKRFAVSIHTPYRSSRETERSFASPLHAAAAGAQAAIIRLLLSLGADPLLRGLSTCLGLGCHGHILTALGMVPVGGAPLCLGYSRWPEKSERDAIRETIDLFLEFQIDAEDCLKLLERAVWRGQADIVKRLLGLRYHTSTVPHTKSPATVDLVGMQKQAVAAGDQSVLLRLIENFGDSLTNVSQHELCKLALSHGHFDMFRFLVSRYVSDINKTWHDETRDSGETLLQMACVLAVCKERAFCDHRQCSRRASTQAIYFLLQAGADPVREQMEDALTTFLQAASHSGGRDDFVSLWPTLRQLERHMPPSHVTNLRKAWRAKSELTLSSDIHAEIGRQETRPNSLASESNPASNDSNNVADIRQQVRPDVKTVASMSIAQQQPHSAAPTPAPHGEEFKHSLLTGRSQSAIRILTLLPSDKADALIECLVTEVDLAELPVYKALSYVWGTTSALKYISVNGKDLRITINLHDALKRLRNSSRPQILWIDAICINQDNISERSQQVAIMGDIYRHAQCVIVWLGEHAEDSHYYFQEMAKCDSLSSDARANAAFDRLCLREWFFRTWVIQELVLSKCAYVQCGQDTVTWDRFSGSRSVPDFHPVRVESIPGRINQLHELQDEISSFGGCMPSHFRDSTWWWWAKSVPLLDYSRSCRSTDPKDRIYGILGLFPPGLMRVDYNLTLQEVFTQFASAVIQWTGNIRILHDYSVRDTLPGLPSWVPDFSSMTLAGTLPRKGRRNSKRLDEKAARVSVNGRQLLIKGMVVDYIKQIGSEISISKEDAVGTPAFLRIMFEWETLAASLDAESFFMDAVSDAFLTTLVAIDLFGEYETCFHEPGVMWYRSCGTGLLETKEPDYFEDVEYYTDLMGPRHGPNWGDYSSRVERCVHGRRFFITENGTMGLAGPMAKEGDQIVLFPGQDYPFIVRDAGEKGTSTMHGDCYLHGLDVGSVELWESDPASIRQFVIV